MTGFDWTPEPVNAAVEGELQVEMEKLRGEHALRYLGRSVNNTRPTPLTELPPSIRRALLL